VIGWSVCGALVFIVALVVLVPRLPQRSLSDHMRPERSLATPPYYPPHATKRG
jgi:hypothetical protein